MAIIAVKRTEPGHYAELVYLVSEETSSTIQGVFDSWIKEQIGEKPNQPGQQMTAWLLAYKKLRFDDFLFDHPEFKKVEYTDLQIGEMGNREMK